MSLITLENDHWQVGILPETGASVAFGRAHTPKGWREIMRPTKEADYGNSSNCGSFIMMPWCNRIKEGKLVFEGETYQLRTEKDDGTARHGDVRKRAWEVISSDPTHVTMRFDSTAHENVNWPFAFTGEADYRLDGADWIWRLSLTNTDTRPMPAGFGHHPYFVRDVRELAIPCATMFELVDFLAVEPPVPVDPALDFRMPRPLDDDMAYNHLLSDRKGNKPARLIYKDVEIKLTSDPLFLHYLIYTPEGEQSVALEPMTNASDGFNLFARGIDASGVFVLAPGETISAEMRLRATTR